MVQRVSHCTDYPQSPALHHLYETLYGDGFDAFCEQRYPKTAIRINADLSVSAVAHNRRLREALQTEPDLRLRQLLYYLRPAADFRAFPQAVTALQSAVATLVTPEEKRWLPWVSLLETATAIAQAIAAHRDLAPQSPLFADITPHQRKSNHNPMLHKGNTSYPLYAQLFNDPKPPSTALTDELTVFMTHQKLAQRLWIYTLLRTTARRLQNRSSARDLVAADPYQFLKLNVKQLPDLSRQANIERVIRTTLTDVDIGFWQFLGDMTTDGYAVFCAKSRQVLHRGFVSEAPPGRVPLKSLSKFLDFFGHERRPSRHHEGGGIGGHHDYPPGHHLWRPSAPWIRQEIDDAGNPHEVHRLRSVETLREEELGDDEESLTQESLSVDLFYGDPDAPSELKLEQYTSHSQLLMATNQQPLWWHQSRLSAATVREFLAFLDDQRTLAQSLATPLTVSAADLLTLVTILGLDLETVLALETTPRMPRSWLQNGAHDSLYDTDNPATHPLRIMPIEGVPEPVWLIPIPPRAFGQNRLHAQTASFIGHRSAIAFFDRSTLGKRLIRAATPLRAQPSFKKPAASRATPVFANHLHSNLRFTVSHLLDRFNTNHSEPVTVEGLRRFGLSILLRDGVPPKLVDLIDPKVPITRRAMLHYFCWPLGQRIKPSNLTLAEILSARTALAVNHPTPVIAPTGMTHGTIGAPGLVNPALIRSLIERLHAAMTVSIPSIHSIETFHGAADRWNATTLYVALSFLMATGHRPHHDLIIDWRTVDPLHLTAVFTDKTDELGSKARLGFIPPILLTLLQRYAQVATRLKSWARQNGFEVNGDALIELHHPIEAPLSVRPFRASALTEAIDRWAPEVAGLEANFGRRLMPYLLRLEATTSPHTDLNHALEKTLPVSESDLNVWLGHWQQGTAPFHVFNSVSVIATFERIAPRLTAALHYLKITPHPIAWPVISAAVTRQLRHMDTALDAERAS